jgi:hypothetical protein
MVVCCQAAAVVVVEPGGPVVVADGFVVVVDEVAAVFAVVTVDGEVEREVEGDVEVVVGVASVATTEVSGRLVTSAPAALTAT